MILIDTKTGTDLYNVMKGGTPLKWVLSPWVGRPIYIHIRTEKPKEFSNSKGLLHFRGVRVSLTKAHQGARGNRYIPERAIYYSLFISSKINFGIFSLSLMV
jgi:hypothetical protein